MLPETIRTYLVEQCDYCFGLVRLDFRFSETGAAAAVPLVAFAHAPVDARSACIAFAQPSASPVSDVAALKELGAPIVFTFAGDSLQWWKQRSAEPELLQTIPVKALPGFFAKHKDEFAPESIYRAKTSGRLGGYQLEFVDLGLMPLVDSKIGEKLTKLVERIIHQLRDDLGWKTPDNKQGQWLFKVALWLLAARILHDKQVDDFVRLDLTDPDQVLARVGKHYGHPASKPVVAAEWQAAVLKAAAAVAHYAPLTHVTTEALADVYESALISRETRQKLGTHSTPSFLVDYMVWRLEPWIKDLPQEQRFVFEVACGHGAFLVSAMRLLRDLFQPSANDPDQTRYLHDHLSGLELDQFALEIAPLSLTLADIPNPNGWNLTCCNMFKGDILEQSARQAMIVLANPPFEHFTPEEREELKAQPQPPRMVNKTAEMLRRVLPVLRPGAMFGVVVPQEFLNWGGAALVRKFLICDCELEEITLFPDRVFKFSGSYSAILLGRRTTKDNPPNGSIRYRHVKDLQLFRTSYQATERRIPQGQFARAPKFDLRAPELEEVWSSAVHFPTMDSLAVVGQGLSFDNKECSKGVNKWSFHKFEGAERGFGRLGRELQIHGHPPEGWLNTTPKFLQSARQGTTTGKPQVLFSCARVSRNPWRIKGFMDPQGHAFNTNYIVLRPYDPNSTPLEYLWAIINSPVANAFAYTHCFNKKQVLSGTMKKLPVPIASSIAVERVCLAVRKYLDLVRGPENTTLQAEVDTERAKQLLLQVDAEVLRLYSLPARLERQLLDTFAGYARRGVPFVMDRYFPEEFEPFIPLHEYLSEAFRDASAGRLVPLMKTDPPSPAVLTVLKAAKQARGG